LHEELVIFCLLGSLLLFALLDGPYIGILDHPCHFLNIFHLQYIILEGMGWELHTRIAWEYRRWLLGTVPII